MQNGPLLAAAWLSIKIAALNACGAVILGTFAALALVRFRHSRGQKPRHHGCCALGDAEVIVGLSLLLLFVAMEDLIGWPNGRGQTTILIAHITFLWPM